MAYTDKLRVVYGDYTLGVHGEGFDYIFSYAQGGLESIVKNGYEWLYRCPKPAFWRALTDNDRGSKFHIKSGSWLSADMFIDCKGIQVIMDGEEQKPYAPDNNSFGGDIFADEIIVKYTYETISNPSTTVLVTYTVDASGKILLLQFQSLLPFICLQFCQRIFIPSVKIFFGQKFFGCLFHRLSGINSFLNSLSVRICKVTHRIFQY